MERYERCISVKPDNPAIIKDDSLCVECGHCLAACDENTGVDGYICINCVQCSMPGAGHTCKA